VASFLFFLRFLILAPLVLMHQKIASIELPDNWTWERTIHGNKGKIEYCFFRPGDQIHGRNNERAIRSTAELKQQLQQHSASSGKSYFGPESCSELQPDYDSDQVLTESESDSDGEPMPPPHHDYIETKEMDLDS
jgi:hypothetical protein